MRDNTKQGVPGQEVSADTALRVENACSAAGLPGWKAAMVECVSGKTFKIEFAAYRPAYFVKEFAALVRESGLKLGADRNLDLYLGTPDAVKRVQQEVGMTSVCEISELGAVDADERASIGVSGARRSAGISYTRRERIRALEGRSALILDDDEVSRKVLTAALVREGCSVHAVGEAEAAFSILRTIAIDAVVLDIVLGGTMDGFEFCRAMRGNRDAVDIPVIFVTGYPSEHPAVAAHHVPSSAYFEKPVKPSALRMTVLELINNHRLANSDHKSDRDISGKESALDAHSR